MKNKKYFILIAVGIIVILIVAFIVLRGMSDHAVPADPRPGAPFDIFEAEEVEQTLMYGAPATWDDEKNLNVDLNNDGVSEEFIITKDKENKILLQGLARDDQGKICADFNFWNANLRSLLPDELRAADSVSAQAFIQISCCDIDEDGVKEVLISVGDKESACLTAVYEYRRSGQDLFQYSGSILSGTKVEYKGDHVLWGYNADCCGGYIPYRYENETILK